jgi:hypothetical protein
MDKGKTRSLNTPMPSFGTISRNHSVAFFLFFHEKNIVIFPFSTRSSGNREPPLSALSLEGCTDRGRGSLGEQSLQPTQKLEESSKVLPYLSLSPRSPGRLSEHAHYLAFSLLNSLHESAYAMTNTPRGQQHG